MAPSTFASAAAGNTNSASQAPIRDAANDWSRRTNGATQTFRRPSGATTTPTTAQHEGPAPRYVPPHRNGTLPDTRYNREQMLEAFRSQQSVDGGLADGLPDLFVGGWQPDIANGASAGWGRNEHNRDAQPGPDVCWDRDGSADPLGLVEMDDEEREYFTTSVNTPIKPTNKDPQQSNGMPGRKISISNSATTPGAFGPLSPNVSRGGGRRRDTSDSYPFPQNAVSSPGGFHRDEGRAASPPPSLQRRRTDLKDDKDGEEKGSSGPFGTLKRHQTGPLSAQFPAPASPWASGPQSAGMSPMGSFGNFGLGQPATQSDKRPGLGSGRSESRFKNLLSKDGSEESGTKTVERKTSMSSLARVNENESWRPGDRMDAANEILDEAEEDLPTGSAALAADADISPPHQRQGYRGYGTPSRQGAQDDFGFGAFGMTSDNTHGFGQGFHPGREAFQQTPAHQRMGLQPEGANDPMSPTNTNPYQSPEQHGVDRMADEGDSEGNDLQNSHLPGLGQFNVDPTQQLGGLGGISAIPNLGRAHGQGPASDRSQTSSVGPHRGFSGLGGLSGLGSISSIPGSAGWPASQGGLGTPSRQTAGLSNAFGGGIFSNQMSDLQSPGLAGLGGAGLMSPQGGAFSGSRMASMFPPQMQEQMQQQNRDGSNERSAQPFGGLGDFGRTTESPFANQGFNELGGKAQHDPSEHQRQPEVPGQNPPPGSSASNLPPAPQQKTMVMPDRMRWIYKDPQGQTQGPWSGLEMHDWYKAGFFSPELLVKKFEDSDYEPLAQLIRRIGNSREPFLVPQIGIPHGQTAPTGPNAWAGSIGSSGSAQPPFASSFPSFGTTLTADQQNALERRKQEEQYLMARQKEHLAQAQIAQRMQMQSGAHPGMVSSGQLHHHSSAHSLQSQPSFGSITSPAAGYQPSPVQGPTSAGPAQQAQGFFDNSFRQPQGSALGAVGAPSLGHIREEEIPSMMDRLDLSNRQQPSHFGAPGQPLPGQQSQQQAQPEAHEGKVQQMLHDRNRLQQEQAEHDAHHDANDAQEIQASAERLQHFQQLQSEALQHAQHQLQEKSGAGPKQHDTSATESSVGSPESSARLEPQQPHESLSLTEQVQKAASAKQSPAPQQPGFPQPFPPPAQSQSPLPAPSAQRTGRASVADQLQTDARDASQTPSLDTPSATIAPWAKESAEAAKGPSLKEIQEAEAKKAAEQEKLALAAKRAQLQHERELEAQAQAVPLQPGIPASATWGASPATPTGSGPAAWAKAAPKPAATTSSKTLAQIQKEEEARKRKQAAAAALQAQANSMNVVSSPAGGKSYANLAGKVSATPVQPGAGGSAWTTVGASGKTKTPAPTPSASRAVSSGVVPTVAAPTARKMPSRSTTLGTSGAVNAQDEFKKWAVNELRPDLKKSFNAEAFVAELLQYPLELDLLVDAVHQSSETIDTRHFAEEWIRRKRLADKGLVDTSVPKTSSPANAGSGAGGWSEVAKKGPSKEQPKEEANGNFRVVAAKKRGGKR